METCWLIYWFFHLIHLFLSSNIIIIIIHKKVITCKCTIVKKLTKGYDSRIVKGTLLPYIYKHEVYNQIQNYIYAKMILTKKLKNNGEISCSKKIHYVEEKLYSGSFHSTDVEIITQAQ